MSQEYTVKSWKVWENEDGLIRDQHGNYKGSVLFNEESGEPIDATFKNQPNVGDKKFGDIVEYTTKAGAARTKFQSAKRLDTPPASTSDTSNWQPRDDMAIRAQWAIGQSVQLELATKGDYSLPHIEETAKQLFTMVDRVKGGSEGTSPKASDTERDILEIFQERDYSREYQSPFDGDEMPPEFLRYS